LKSSPWYGSTANDIDWTKRVEIQGIITKIYNYIVYLQVQLILPGTVTEQEVSVIFTWKVGKEVLKVNYCL
jgi:hypothetical protein